MRISDRYERFADRVATSGTSASKQASLVGAKDKASAVAAARGAEPGVLTVSISDVAGHLSANAAKLEQLKASIQDGSFRVDAQAIAKKLVGDE